MAAVPPLPTILGFGVIPVLAELDEERRRAARLVVVVY
jgi:hypothetical protein